MNSDARVQSWRLDQAVAVADMADASVSSVTDAAQALVRRAQEMVLPAAATSWSLVVGEPKAIGNWW